VKTIWDRYYGLNYGFILLVFLSKRKKKINGRLYSYHHIRKYRNAIQWGARKAKQTLPSSFVREMKLFLEAYQKETMNEKQRGELDDEEAESDPVPAPPPIPLLFGLLPMSNIWKCLNGF
jgi:hypothetical protein